MTTVLREKLSNIYKSFTLPETRVTDLHFAYDSLGLYLLFFTKASLKVEPSESKRADTKT